LGRSNRTGGRAGGRRPAAPQPSPPDDASGDRAAATPSLAAATLPRVWQDVGYRPLADTERARAMFDFAAVPWPEPLALAWGAWTAGADGERLIGAIAGERHGSAAMLHGPVVVTDIAGSGVPRSANESPTVGRVSAPTDLPIDPLEIAGQLLGAALDHATALGATTIYARPQGLDRVWVRFGFIPVPEVALPAALAGRPGVGLYAWRGGSALWTLREAAAG
jgi:hypothetical protein